MEARIIYTDVLIIGSGGAGLRAALEARKFGAEVLIVSKTPVGFATCTFYSMGGFKAAVRGLSEEDLFAKTIEYGRYLNNQHLVEILIKEGPYRLLELEKFGIHLVPHFGGYWVNGPSGKRGQELTKSLKDACLKVGVKPLENVIVIDLILTLGKVAGVFALDLGRNAMLVIGAKSTILATGGSGQIYSRTDNPSRITGDGYAIALRVGAELIDMEFVQFTPIGLAEPNLPTLLFPSDEILSVGTLRNVLGENLNQKYKLSRCFIGEHSDMVMRSMGLEIYNGRGIDGSLLLDLTHLPDNIRVKDGIHQEEIEMILSRLAKSGLDIKQKPIRVSPLAHCVLGGIRINERCETSLPGLYAAGEVTGGIHGANRLGGNALTELMVFGSRAGRYAAEYASATESLHIESNLIKEKLDEISEFMNKSGEGVSPEEIKRYIKEIMWGYVGIVRSESSLKEAIDRLSYIRQTKLSEIFAANRIELLATFEAMNMLQVAEAITASALFREETRGMHFRVDYPQQDDKKWLLNSLITSEQGRIRLKTISPLVTKLKPKL
jgi:succinate dehydrogenase/fumarate reductase flavoprotein subunit